jgi:hypothetical protein
MMLPERERLLIELEECILVEAPPNTKEQVQSAISRYIEQVESLGIIQEIVWICDSQEHWLKVLNIYKDSYPSSMRQSPRGHRLRMLGSGLIHNMNGLLPTEVLNIDRENLRSFYAFVLEHNGHVITTVLKETE